MALFVVRHQHAPDRCPAQDPYMGATLLHYLSRPNVSQHGVKIQGEAVVHADSGRLTGRSGLIGSIGSNRVARVARVRRVDPVARVTAAR